MILCTMNCVVRANQNMVECLGKLFHTADVSERLDFLE